MFNVTKKIVLHLTINNVTHSYQSGNKDNNVDVVVELRLKTRKQVRSDL